ncbi:hypothetical protein TRFO_27708 [Tritrichomonas foetus]|uniref:Leucine Rich Repeat family protein n=1 Tax=Tritrichomonas foetus TaxID=1144522 RepID=A0A1J4JZW6_9EUKA|nr:hypothetical protein TRFO_27708 [Tritrichomonas foetus]|eukprot:OHT04705.1 hypothetical protein TRFO_27708 [Tritrichomonas foetus]
MTKHYSIFFLIHRIQYSIVLSFAIQNDLMTLLDKETLGVLSPVFKISRVQILWDDVVNEVEENGQLSSRICLIATTGIYLVKKKSFPHPAKIVNFIPFSDVNTISVTDDKTTFMSYRSKITIQHQNVSPFAFITYCIRKSQFPLSMLPLKTCFPNEEPFTLINNSSPYQPASLFIDRIITCAMHLKVEVTPQILKMIINDLIIKDNTFTITKQITKSLLFPAIMLSLPYEKELDQIILDSCNLSKILHNFEEIFLRGNQVTRLMFVNCDFTDSLHHFQRLISTNNVLKPSNWVFSHINITDSFASFFDALNLLSCNIISLTFDNCVFTPDSMSAVFQSILFNACFHHLESFSLDGTINYFDLPLQVASLTCCSWVMLSKCLHSISLSHCNMDAVSVIPQLLNFDTGLRELRMSGCLFTSNLVFSRPPVLNHLAHLDLSCSKFTVDSLLSVFEVIRTKVFIIDGLDLSSLNISKDEKTEFLQKLSKIQVDPLITFIFDDNELNDEQTTFLANFVVNQKNLIHLSLNNSIDVTNSNSCIPILFSSLEKLNLASLSLRSEKSPKFSFGRILIDRIPPLLSKHCIKYLDITGQLFYDEGLEMLKANLDCELEDLYIDGTQSSLDAIIDFCEAAIESPLKFVSYPSNDFSRAAEKSNEDPNKLQHIEDDIFNRFFARFSRKPTERLWKRLMKINDQKVEDKNILCKRENSIPGLKRYPISQFFIDSIANRNPELESLFNECIDTKSENFKEAIFKYVEQIDEKLSFHSLMQIE